MHLVRTLNAVADTALDLLYPTCCLGCDERGEWFCQRCTEASVLNRVLDHCQLCNRITETPGALCRSDREQLHLTGLVSFGDYRAAPLRRAIRLVKFDGIYGGIPGLFEAGLTRYKPVLAHKNWAAIIPIPLSRQRLRERGFNQAELIARAVATGLTNDHTATDLFAERHGKIPLDPPSQRGKDSLLSQRRVRLGSLADARRVGEDLRRATESIVRTDLVRTKHTRHQTELGRREREENMQDAFAWHGDRLHGSVLLVDDVVTTGATLASAARVLRQSGAREVWGLTLAYETYG